MSTINAVWPIAKNIDPEGYQKLPEHEVVTLKNGLRVFFMCDSNDRSSYFKMMINAGAIHQVPGKRGVPHFTEHMLFQGSDMFGSKRELLQFANEYNLDYNGYTDNDHQAFHVESDNDDESIVSAVKLLSQIVFHPTFPEAKVEKEKQVILSERHAMLSDPESYTWEIFSNHLYSEQHPFSGGGVIGNDVEILGFTAEDAKNFYETYFHPTNMILLVSGGRDKEFYAKLVSEYFDIDVRSNRKWDQNPIINEVRKTEMKNTESKAAFNHVNLYISKYIPAAEIEYPSLEYLSLKMSAQALSNRIFLDIRDAQGLAYDTGASVFDTHDGYLFYVYGEFPSKNYLEARTKLEAYLDQIISEPINKDELRRALRIYKSTRWAKSTRSIAKFVSNWLFTHGQIISPEAFYPLYEQLDLDTVINNTNKILEGKVSETIAVGPLV